ncbi:DUF3231 family protein [Bacillus sp. BRMEA1]|uniref:DUF3231 family protein n=1 Tax=Neobacillus endophyticus TaxID=2738405 RepID=UPI001567A377|nr:DUF3231 family protein [Neobacillus endophyticus]NRD76448.1 DUF3231 family protein [Neobacillus endophyticus]
MGEQRIMLSSSEIGSLWAIYLQESMKVCLLTYFLHYVEDEEVKEQLERAYKMVKGHFDQITKVLNEEGIPLPTGFTEKDLNLEAPKLFYDMFALSFVYSISRMTIISISFVLANVARKDIMDLFSLMINDSTVLYREATTLMLSKGIYDRSPKIPYPKEVEFVEKKSYISGFGKKRPINAVEITEIFFNTERNYFSILLCMGLLQVVKDKEIHEYIQEGKKISEKQINTFNDILKREELLGNVPLNVEVSDSTIPPFSDRLVVMLFHSLNAIDITLIGHALSLSMRTDLALQYEKYIAEVLMYGAKGFNIMVDRGWLEMPPHAPDRRKLQKLQ